MLPLSIILYLYLLFLAIWAVFSLTALYHLFKFGFRNTITFVAISTYLTLSGAILLITVYYAVDVDWQASIIEQPAPVTNNGLWPAIK
jgi:hypothetical protein